MNSDYSSPLSLTSQFRFCGNPFRLDFYKFCTFGCKYCFARNINGQEDFNKSYAKFDIVEKQFIKAFETDKSGDINIELLRHKVPIHVGGLADPFQPFEFKMKLNYKLIELSNKYDYPLIFSTKTGMLPKEYWEILNPKLHAFQISLIGVDDDYIKKYETNTFSASERLNFLKELRDKGFWCSIRIQPVIDIEQVLKLCKKIDGIASYVTVEHLKINTDNEKMKEMFKDKIQDYARTSIMRNLELPSKVKIENIKRIKECLPNTKVGVGDNDLHYLSDSRCCCGIDTIGLEFQNWLKYNLTYFTTEHLSDTKASDEEYYIPKSNVRNCVNGDIRVKNVRSFKDYTDMYCGKYSHFMCDGCSMKNKLDGIMFDNNGDKHKQINIFSIEEGEND